ncbi:MAG: hypothetical protein RL095_1182 [Verrucomicrobiota bacterium]|jgi:hypothetical protein
MSHRPLALVAAVCALFALHFHGEKKRLADEEKSARLDQASAVPVEMRRRGDNTFLTIPEWNLVFGPEEYADFMKDRQPSQFPFFGQLRQYWDCYNAIYARVEPDYPYNGEYHLMDTVIGVSATGEYTLMCGYERTVGRLSELTRSGKTAEDELAAKVARDYVEFVKIYPWYKFDFATPLKQVWTGTGFRGDNQIRKWERKYFLTSEYAIKVAYAWLIKKGSESAFEVEEMTTPVVLDHLPEAARREFPEIKELKRFADGSLLCTVPRYQAFTDHALGLARHGVVFRDIAGNHGVILVSILAPDSFVPKQPILLSQEQLTHPGSRRLVLEVPVARLSEVLLSLQRPEVKLEHVYDF